MQPSFNIHSNNSNTAQQQLFLQLGRQGVSLLTFDALAKSFNDIVCYHFSNGLSADELAAQLRTIFAEEVLLQQSFTKIDIIHTLPESVLTPHEVFADIDHEAMLDTIFGDAVDGEVKTDFMYRHSLHNVYRVPKLLDAVISRQFPFANNSHQYSLLPNTFSGDGLFAIFYPHSVTVLLRKAGQLQVIQSFSFSIPEDAAYHLLNVCASFDAPVNETQLLLYGMIEQDSALYSCLYKYFINISFAGLPEEFAFPEQADEYPDHYFTHLFGTALCV